MVEHMKSSYINLKDGLHISLLRQMRLESDEERNEMLNFIENQLPEFIRKYLDSNFTNVFEQIQPSYYQDLRIILISVPEAEKIDQENNLKYSKAIKYYHSFLNSKFFPKNDLQTVSPKIETKPVDQDFVEGAEVQQTIDRRERNPQARAAAIERDKGICQVCNFDFEATYGEAGKGYIEVHHLHPISQTEGEHEVNIDYLICLCANCHAMAHRRKPKPFSPQELREMLNKIKNEQA